MVEFMYTKEYNDCVEEQGVEVVSTSENTEIGTPNQGKRHGYKLLELH